MKRAISLLLLVLSINLLSAQERKAWTINITIMTGAQNKDSDIDKWGDGAKLLPSVSYNLKPWLSFGLELNLPLSNRSYWSSTGGEVFASLHTPQIAGFRFSLSPVFGLHIVGAYKQEYGRYEVIGISFNHPDLHDIKHRWHAGLRPTISYAFNNQWSASLSYGFWGYRSQEDLYDVYYVGTNNTKGKWGFTSNPTYSSSWRLGISYSF